MEEKTFSYPRFQKSVNFLALLLSVAVAVILVGLLFFRLLRTEIDDVTIVPAMILLAISFIIVGLLVNMGTPDIILKDDGFQLKTFFYRSRWLKWKEIQSVKQIYLSSRVLRIYGIQIEQLNLIYFLVGLTQNLGGRGFLVTERIGNFEYLIGVLKGKRPDLFQTENLLRGV